MVIGIIGESCTGKSTLAKMIADRIDCEVFAGKDYLRFAKNEEIAKKLFHEKLNNCIENKHIIYIISEKEHITLLPKEALRILVTADLQLIKARFSQRMNGNLPAPVANMLERKHGSFDKERHDIHIISETGNQEDKISDILNAIEMKE